MTQKLEDFFNVEAQNTDRSESVNEDQQPLVEQNSLVALPDAIMDMNSALDIADRIDRALPQVRGLDTEDRELDEYAAKAMDTFDKLIDLGFNMDDRNAGKVFEVASTMMGNAIAAKTAKLDKKLKMIDLQLKAAKLAQTQKQDDNPEPNGELNTDRNAILNLISQNLKNKDK
jgi:hypothetical protein